MDSTFKALQISDHAYWVGAVDWDIREFHGYSTNRGTTYNAFLVLGEKVALIDTVKRPFLDEMISRIASVVPPEKVDYIISNHSEMDHSGCLPHVQKLMKPEKIFASTRGIRCLQDHFQLDQEITPVKDGEKISMGNLTLSFIDTPMLHWPESMFTYLVEDSVLFSQDAFGMHLATSDLFADEMDASVINYEAAKYFANILLPYASRVGTLMEKVAGLGLDFRMIAPDHGPLWRNPPSLIIDYYHEWAQQQPKKKALVVYDTMWESTAIMAGAVGEGLAQGGVKHRLMPIRSTHRSDVATELLDAGAVIVGSATLNNNLLPTVADILTYIKGLKPKNLLGAAFGSFGWSGEAVKQIMETFNEMNVEVVGEGVRVKYVPDKAALDQCRALGIQVAEKLGQICA